MGSCIVCLLVFISVEQDTMNAMMAVHKRTAQHLCQVSVEGGERTYCQQRPDPDTLPAKPSQAPAPFSSLSFSSPRTCSTVASTFSVIKSSTPFKNHTATIASATKGITLAHASWYARA